VQPIIEFTLYSRLKATIMPRAITMVAVMANPLKQVAKQPKFQEAFAHL